jgi:YgiT-type zinc finger domain-containing protein
MMKCVVCKNGETKQGETNVTLTRKNTTAVFKKVPAKVCENCGEAYVDDEVTSELLSLAEEIAEKGVEVDVRTYKAA